MDLDCSDVKRARKSSTNLIHTKKIAQLREIVDAHYPYHQNIKKLSRPELCMIVEDLNSKPKIILTNVRNSCFIDALLTALLFDIQSRKWLNNVFLSRHALKIDSSIQRAIQDQLRHIYTYILRPDQDEGDKQIMTDEFKCTDLRRLFREYDIQNKNGKKYSHVSSSSFNDSKNYFTDHRTMPSSISSISSSLSNGSHDINALGIDWIKDQNEPNDVINILSKVFRFPNDVVVSTKLPSGEVRISKENFHTVTVMTNYLDSKRIDLNDFITKRTYSESIVLDAQFLFVSVFRGSNC